MFTHSHNCKADVRRAIKNVRYCHTTISYNFYCMCNIESCTTFYRTTKVVRYRTCPIFSRTISPKRCDVIVQTPAVCKQNGGVVC